MVKLYTQNVFLNNLLNYLYLDYDKLERRQNNIVNPKIPRLFRRNVPRYATKWPGGVMPYKISSAFNSKEQSLIIQHMNYLTMRTSNCVKFVEQTNERHYANIIKINAGCFADVGMQTFYYPQTIKLAPSCLSRGTVIHEVLHALGFHHEQNRPDRAKYIDLYENNIISQWRYAFDLQVGANTLNMPYDIGW